MLHMYADLKYPFVARIEDIPTDDHLRLMLVDGRTFVYDVSELKGFTDRLKRLTLGDKHWCEIGVHKNGALYVEIVYTSQDFDAYHQDIRRIKNLPDYRDWKYQHKVPIEISPDIDLYYDSINKGFIS